MADNEAINLKEKLIDIPELIYAFISPSGGIKFGIATDFHSKDTDTLKYEFKHAYALTKQYIQDQIDDIELDDSVVAVNQGCYFSYDPEAFISKLPSILPIAKQARILRIEQETVENTRRINATQDCGNIDKNEALKALQFIPANGVKYQDRLAINLSVISIFGGEAEEILLSACFKSNKAPLQVEY